MIGRKIIRSGLTVFVAMLLALALTGSATSKAVDVLSVDDRTAVQYVTDNPCTDGFDSINLAGETHIKGQLMTDEIGILYFNGHISTHLSGQDAMGIRYIVNMEENIKSKGTGTLTDIYNLRAISQGPAPDYYLKVRVHMNPDGTVRSEYDSGCKV